MTRSWKARRFPRWSASAHWKEWQARFDVIDVPGCRSRNHAAGHGRHQPSGEGTQQTVEELTQKVERRINEITEIQRLAEERFRQEWVTFKADDQKRWTNYTLTLEEQRNETTARTKS